jgi:hypothetical protein
MSKIALCIVCKDDEEALIENILYHSLIGVDNFIVFDNLSKIPLVDTLSQFSNVEVVVTDGDGKTSSIHACYDICLENYGKHFDWIGFIDTDEYIVIKDGSCNIGEFLNKYESFGGIGINWKCFGSSGHETSQKSIIDSYTIAPVSLSDNIHIKSIVRPEAVLRRGGDPHSFIYKEGFYCVNEFGEPIIKPEGDEFERAGAFNTPPTHIKCQLNHYITRSSQDFMLKRLRFGDSPDGSRLTEEFWYRFQGGERDTSIFEFISKVKQLNNE